MPKTKTLDDGRRLRLPIGQREAIEAALKPRETEPEWIRRAVEEKLAREKTT